MATVTQYPTGYAGNTTDFLKAKADYSGAVRLVRETVTVTAGTSVGTYIGITPFRAGAKVNMFGSGIWTGDGSTGSGTVLTCGYTYDSTASGADSTAAFFAGSTVVDSGGFMPFASSLGSTIGMTWTAGGDGWIMISPVTAAISTAAACTLLANLLISYGSNG